MDPETDFTPEEIITENNPPELLQREIEQLREDNKRLQERLSELEKDQLTNLDGKKLFGEKARQTLATLARENPNAPVTFLFVDFNNMKAYNDEYGHQKVDEALSLLGQVLNEKLSRSSDLKGRRSGDELFALLPNTPQSAALGLVNEIHNTFFEQQIDFPWGEDKLSLSIGVFTGNPKDSLPHLEKQAEEAMYLAKNSRKKELTQGILNNQELRSKMGRTGVMTNQGPQLALG